VDLLSWQVKHLIVLVPHGFLLKAAPLELLCISAFLFGPLLLQFSGLKLSLLVHTQGIFLATRGRLNLNLAEVLKLNWLRRDNWPVFSLLLMLAHVISFDTIVDLAIIVVVFRGSLHRLALNVSLILVLSVTSFIILLPCRS
jgi:hypothetical protein